ncbi:MAG: hypothetical protein ABI718_11350 [Acidobacteriota bacterium]
MPVLRSLNETGIERFRQFLRLVRGGQSVSSPAFTFDDICALPVSATIRVEQKQFATKFEMTAYLQRVLEKVDRPDLLEDAGLWSWLALFYFDLIAPERGGQRRPREDYHYILVSGGDRASGWYLNRHLIAGPWELFRRHGIHSRVLLSGSPDEHGKFMYDLAWRTDLVSNRGLLEAVDRLYFDEEANRPKRGATSRTIPGNLRRLIAVLQQLDFNFDLQGMTAQRILELLPPEFDRWKK